MKQLKNTQIEEKLKDLNGWKLLNNAIEKTFLFKDFKEAMSVMQHIAFEAEALNHHPEWFNVYNKLNIRLTTHDANGITEKDFVLAEKIDVIVNYK